MKNIIILLEYLFPLLLSAQTGYLTIRGRIVDATTQTAIPTATVYTVNKGVITQSNADGVYELKLQAPHRDDLIVFSAYGYLRDTISVHKLTRHPDVKLKEGTVATAPSEFHLSLLFL